MPRTALTQSLVDSLPSGPRVIEHRDSERRGLMLRIYPSGERCFYLWYQSTTQRSATSGHHKSERVKLGHAGTLTLQQARKMVGDRLHALRLPDGKFAPPSGAGSVVDVVMPGVGPQGVTVQTLCSAYLADVPMAPDTQRQYRQILKAKVIPHLGLRIAESVTRHEWVTWGKMLRETHGGVMANRCHQMVRGAFRWGTSTGLIQSTAATWEGMPMPYLERARKTVLTPEFLRAAWVALDAFDHNKYWLPDVARLLMLTWCRVRQVNGLMRDEVMDMGTAMARVVISPGRPGSKRRQRARDPRPHIIPLAPIATRIVQRRLMLAPGDALFPAYADPDREAPRASFERWKQRWALATGCVLASGPPPADKPGRAKWFAAGGPESAFRVHDIRASALTHSLEQLGLNLSLAPLLLGHTSSGLMHLGEPNLPGATQIYNRALMLDQRRAALEKWEAWLTKE